MGGVFLKFFFAVGTICQIVRAKAPSPISKAGFFLSTSHPDTFLILGRVDVAESKKRL